MDERLGIDYCYHTHTKRCGHAYGEDEEYVQAAISKGYKYIGFSDHGMFLDIDKKYYGRDHKYFFDYIDSINALKQKYAGTAEIYLGAEFEYSEEYNGFFHDLFDKYGYDYLICGQHFYIKDHTIGHYFETLDDYEELEHYKNDVIKAIESGLFLYIAHPDLFFNRFTSVTPTIKRVCREIVECAVKHDIPLEVNLGGMRYNNMIAQINGAMPYPNKYFFEIARELGAKVVIGIDAHSPRDIEYYSAFDFAKKFCEDLHLNLITDLRIKK